MIVLRPFLMLASVAFVTGFAGYLAVAQVQHLTSPMAVAPPTISAATSADSPETWDMGQRI